MFCMVCASVSPIRIVFQWPALSLLKSDVVVQPPLPWAHSKKNTAFPTANPEGPALYCEGGLALSEKLPVAAAACPAPAVKVTGCP
jgi:hypothetical protein